MKNKIKRSILILLAMVMLLQVSAFGAGGNLFPDVEANDWFAADVESLVSLGVLEGREDGLFHPNEQIKRGEFMKMLVIAAENIWSTTPSKGIHWAESDWNALNEAGVLEVVESKTDKVQISYPIIPLTYAELEKPINRYETAYMINRVLYLVYYENQMKLKDDSDSFGKHIADYNTMDKAFQGSVEQVYSKGILSGYNDSSFQGGNNLTRAESATVIVRLLWNSKREARSYAVEKEKPAVDPGFTSFAMQYRSLSNAQRRQMLFGNPNKTYFTSAADAKGYMVSVEVPIWQVNSAGVKVSKKTWLSVHKLVATEVKAIFTDIYNDPERFPIQQVGGARFSDTMRHSWGAAIDINPNENYYINYKTGQKIGSFCYKNGTSPYCITPNGSVVRAFAKYGWGWGGQGWSTAADYMHFSILASGG